MKRAFLCENQQAVKVLSNYHGDTFNFFFFFLIYGQLTFVLEYRIYSFVHSEFKILEGVSKFSFLFRAMKRKLLANIWKGSSAPFVPSFTPLVYVLFIGKQATDLILIFLKLLEFFSFSSFLSSFFIWRWLGKTYRAIALITRQIYM